jgi:UDP-glucose:(heptosyl)LPS alpha-1,3-glucosyltransferase
MKTGFVPSIRTFWRESTGIDGPRPPTMQGPFGNAAPGVFRMADVGIGSRMRVALVRYRYSPHGGAERYVDSLAEGLASAGAEVRILSADWEVSPGRGFSVETISIPHRPSPVRLFLFADRVRAWARANPGWLLFSFERIPGAEVFRAGDGCHAEWLIRKRPLRPRSWRLDYLRPFNLSSMVLEQKTFCSETLRAVIAISQMVKQDILRHFGIPGEIISVVYNGVDLTRFPMEHKAEARDSLRRLLGLAPEETLFLYVGSGFARKGVRTLARAAARVAAKGIPFRLVLVGKGDPGPYLSESGAARGRLLFTGPRKDAEEYFLGADAFVFPTLYEPFGSVCLEAMAAGLPVVTSRFSGASEILSDGESGFVLEDPLDDAALADRMERLCRQDLREKMGVASRKTSESMSREKNVRETLAVLAEAWRRKKEDQSWG